MNDDEQLLDTQMSASGGKPHAVGKLLRMTAKMMDQLPEDMQLNVELDVWEVGVRDDD